MEEKLDEEVLTEEIVDTKRKRNFMILFYDDTTSYNFDDVIFNIHSLKYYAYIKHLPESDELKVHYHAYIHLDSACTSSALAKRIGIPDNFVKPVKNIRGACRYLTHIDYPEKIQYSVDYVKISGLFQRQFLKQFEDIKTEQEIISDLYEWIDFWRYDTYSTKLKDFIQYVNLHCYDTIYKRYRYEFLDYMKQNL